MYEIFLNWFGNETLSMFLSAALPLFVAIVPFALFAVLMERKVSAHMQDRLGPMRVGFHGVLQTVADILKLMQKEDIVASNNDKRWFNLAPYLVFVGSFAAFAVIPFSSKYIGSHAEVGLFYILSVSGIVVAGILMGSWSSNNKYSLLGGMRSVAQIVSYEIPTALVVLTMVMLTRTLSLDTMSQQQTAYFWNWNLFGGAGHGFVQLLLIPFMVVAFLILFISTLAEVNRTPFDIAEAESELVSGFHTEYTGMKFAMFFLAEYANMFAVSAIIAIVFLGGYQSPFGYLGNTLGIHWLIPIEQLFWFASKAMFFVFVQMWLRWTLPRLRVDQLMTLCWKYLIPYAIVNLVIVGILTLF